MIRIRNWAKYQSYKDRRPPWIRFHRSMLDNYEFQCMSSEARALLPMLWLLACEDVDPTSGLIQSDIKKIAFRLRMAQTTLKAAIDELQLSDFIECIQSVTKPLQNRNEIVTPETETETETDLISEPEAQEKDELIIEIPTNRYNTKQEVYGVTKTQYEVWAQDYPNVNVKQSLINMKNWSNANKTKRKTIGGMESFINRWLMKEQNVGHAQPKQQSNYREFGS